MEVEVPTQVPAHIGIIMDGNGRWAKNVMQPRVFGHKAGMEALQTVTKAANKLGVKGYYSLCFLQKTGPVQIRKSSLS